MSRRERGWVATLAEVARAVRADLGLLAPALIVMGMALVLGYLAWSLI